MRRWRQTVPVALGLALVALGQGHVAAQSVESSLAVDYMGSWTTNLETEIGPFDLTLHVEDEGGLVAARIVTGGTGEAAPREISLVEDALVMKYDVDFQGQPIDVVLTLRRSGDDLAYSLDAASGTYSMSGTARRVEG